MFGSLSQMKSSLIFVRTSILVSVDNIKKLSTLYHQECHTVPQTLQSPAGLQHVNMSPEVAKLRGQPYVCLMLIIIYKIVYYTDFCIRHGLSPPPSAPATHTILRNELGINIISYLFCTYFLL